MLTSRSWSIAHILPHYQSDIQDHIKEQLARTREKIPSIKIDFHPNRDPRTAYNSTKLALLIEGRAPPHLVPHILHMISVVPPDWRFLFIGSNKSVISIGKSFAIKYQQAAGKLDLMIAPKPWEINNKENVWRMLTDMRFYDELLPGVEWIMKYESDSIMCANSKYGLNDWLHFDWAAAPRYVVWHTLLGLGMPCCLSTCALFTFYLLLYGMRPPQWDRRPLTVRLYYAYHSKTIEDRNSAC